MFGAVWGDVSRRRVFWSLFWVCRVVLCPFGEECCHLEEARLDEVILYSIFDVHMSHVYF
jgi:hypothetical protein